jgi:hypothetical protein
VAALKEDQRNRELTDRGEIERDQPGVQIGGGELIAFPNETDFLVTVVGGKPGERAFGRIVVPRGHKAAIKTNSFALDVQVFDGGDLAGGGVGGDGLELAHRLGIARAARGVHGEAPASTLVLGVGRSAGQRLYRRAAIRGDASRAEGQGSSTVAASAVDRCWTQKAPKISKAELADARAAYDHAREVHTQLVAECAL